MFDDFADDAHVHAQKSTRKELQWLD